MQTNTVTVRGLEAGAVDLQHDPETGVLVGLHINDVVIDLDRARFNNETADDVGERVAALEHLAAVAIEAASELLTGRRLQTT
ncbi:hypothetical protein DFP74_5765 [Nocardiopsis sp. Huas11]|uniref:hypothetical protein n=1 Tax=Nocardiopsis sp. Huas11 TaxID=2183912 RepID=UPI000EB16563|nr:hypothetical protein [Nocardiopsis sp. Huas11]RKS10019.1 hypothetical protein DFP74_5765 [Nocardiopsis sp. Huas11]